MQNLPERVSFPQLLALYEQAIAAIEAAPRPAQAQLLEALVVRDRLQEILATSAVVSGQDLVQLDSADKRLKGSAAKLKALDPHWRSDFPPGEDAWWWPAPPKPPAKPNWLWNSLSIIFLAASASLVLNAASRFVAQGVATTGTFPIVVQALLTLVAGKGALTASGREGWEQFLVGRKVDKAQWPKWNSLAAAGLFLLVAGIHASMPWIATWYNRWGWQNFETRRLGSALRNFQTALALQPDYPEAHFNLGLTYEDLQQEEKAIAQYQFVVEADREEVPQEVWLSAYNNLARLYILEDNAAEAAPLLVEANAGVDAELAQSDPAIAEVSYNLLKNLGWARLQQGNYPEAAQELERAIAFDRAILEGDRAAAYCLLAVVYQAWQPARADAPWQWCIRNADRSIPEEDAWIGQYQRRLTEGVE
ncbi:MAG: tetratricopeptide repeat protein [Elainellaceae cyanobacterium]